MGRKVLKPDINKSGSDFVVEDNHVRYALGAIKGVGEANMRSIVAEREAHGPYKDMSDFIHRTDAKQINRRQMEQLIKAGAFDCLEKNRGKLFANVELIMRHIYSSTEMKNSEQTSLFGTEELTSKVKLADKPDWPELEKLRLEAEAIGFYLSAHPLDSYGKGMENWELKAASKSSAISRPEIRFAPNWPAVLPVSRNASVNPVTNMPFGAFRYQRQF